MNKITSVIVKVIMLTVLVAQLAFASEDQVVNSAFAEPLYLSLCGLILLSFGLMKGRGEDKDI